MQVTTLLLFGLALASALLDRSVLQQDVTVPWSLCSDEEGSGSSRHELFLNQLNGRRISFVGDSLLRYQYLELAHYLIHGKCPEEPTAGKVVQGYILSASRQAFPDGFGQFIQDTSAGLNVDSAAITTREVAFGGRVQNWVSPLATGELRSFVYQDVEGRRIELQYVFYYTERHSSLELAFQMANNTLPTDMVVNFGIWLSNEPANTTCGDEETDWRGYERSRCPFMPGVCDFFEEEHDFNLFWSTTPPAVDEEDATNIRENVGFDHNLHVPSICGLLDEQILDRTEMVDLVEPDQAQQSALYADIVHFLSPEPYHAFNWQLLDRLMRA